VTRRTYGILAAGVAIGAWLWRRRMDRPSGQRMPHRDRGTVIYRNTPVSPSNVGL